MSNTKKTLKDTKTRLNSEIKKTNLNLSKLHTKEKDDRAKN